jgi:hypothetical protein
MAGQVIDYRKLYDVFVSALEARLGLKDPAVRHAIIGFEFGGPPDILFFRQTPMGKGTCYVTSDLLFFDRQPKNSLGHYELAIWLPKEDKWAETVLYKLAQATLNEVFDERDTVDITAWVEATSPIQGLLLTKLVSFEFDRQNFGVLLCVGVTRAELDYALENGSEKLLKILEDSGAFPFSDTQRPSLL